MAFPTLSIDLLIERATLEVIRLYADWYQLPSEMSHQDILGKLGKIKHLPMIEGVEWRLVKVAGQEDVDKVTHSTCGLVPLALTPTAYVSDGGDARSSASTPDPSTSIDRYPVQVATPEEPQPLSARETSPPRHSTPVADCGEDRTGPTTKGGMTAYRRHCPNPLSFGKPIWTHSDNVSDNGLSSPISMLWELPPPHELHDLLSPFSYTFPSPVPSPVDSGSREEASPTTSLGKRRSEEPENDQPGIPPLKRLRPDESTVITGEYKVPTRSRCSEEPDGGSPRSSSSSKKRLRIVTSSARTPSPIASSSLLPPSSPPVASSYSPRRATRYDPVRDSCSSPVQTFNLQFPPSEDTPTFEYLDHPELNLFMSMPLPHDRAYDCASFIFGEHGEIYAKPPWYDDHPRVFGRGLRSDAPIRPFEE